MIPIQSHWEYEQAKRMDSYYCSKWHKSPLSKQDANEWSELMARIEKYEANPTPPTSSTLQKGTYNIYKN